MRIDFRLENIRKGGEAFFSSFEKEVFDFKKMPFNFLGKAVRSRFALLFSSALGLEMGKAERIALWSELVHTASLLHDDCVDNASFRRGELTINARFGTNIAILLGDLIIGKVFKDVNSFSSDIALSLAEMVSRMSQGALMEENFRYKILQMEDYEKMVSFKTSSLFRWISLSLVFLSGRRFFEEAVAISEAFGLSFQAIDDLLDIETGINDGKDRFKDISEGRFTFPFIMAAQDAKMSDLLRKKISELRKNGRDLLIAYEMAKLIEENGFIEKSREKARMMIESIESKVLKLPEKNEAKKFYDYIYSLSYRRV